MNLEEQLNYKLFIGIDVSKKTIDTAIVNDFGKKIGHKNLQIINLVLILA